MNYIKEDAHGGIAQRIEQRKKDLFEKQKQYKSLLEDAASLVEEQQDILDEKLSSSTLIQSIIAEANAAAQAVLNEVTLPQESITKINQVASIQEVMNQKNEIKDQLKLPESLNAITQKSKRYSSVLEINIQPVSLTRYDKSCQSNSVSTTSTSEEPKEAKEYHKYTSIEIPTEHIKADDVLQQSTTELSSKHCLGVQSNVQETSSNDIESSCFDISNDEREKILSSKNLESFVTQAAKTIESTLGQRELFPDFFRLRAAENVVDTAQHYEVHNLRTYESLDWSAGRPILNLRRHPQFPDIFLATYGKKVNSTVVDPEGCALVWNLAMTHQTEGDFFCHSPVCTATFDPYRPNCIIGGVLSGAIIVWDTRATKYPVQRTPLSPKSHQHPVYCLEIVGSQNAHNLITLDDDGRVCTWSTSMLSEPTETLELRKTSKDSSFLCLDFSPEEANSFLTGTDNGSIYSVQLHGNQAGVVSTCQNSHTAPVTSLHWHPALDHNEGYEFNLTHLFLSSSFDWNVKLWHSQQPNPLLHTFEGAVDNTLDVKWHPKHPGMFISVQSDGTFHIWDISHSIQTPRIAHASPSQEALTQVVWSRDGANFLIGDTTGKISLWGLPVDVTRARQETVEAVQSSLRDLMSTSSSYEQDYSVY